MPQPPFKRPGYTTLAGPDKVTVTSASQALTALVTVNQNIRILTMIPASTGVFWANGTATTSSSPLPHGTNELRCKYDEAILREFITASASISMDVIQEG